MDIKEPHGTAKLVYTKCAGPPSRKMLEGSGKQNLDIWNVRGAHPMP